MSLARRLDRLSVVYRAPRPARGPASEFDATRLSFAEQAELDDLLRPPEPLPGERVDLQGLTDEQLDRAHELLRKAHGLPPEPAYDYMPHRDPGIGPCRCAACLGEQPR